METNNRISQRQKVFKTAKIISADRSIVTEVVIKNISETGALVLITNQLSLPQAFSFYLTKDNKICEARVVWRKEGTAGITFTTAFGDPSPIYLKYRS